MNSRTKADAQAPAQSDRQTLPEPPPSQLPTNAYLPPPTEDLAGLPSSFGRYLIKKQLGRGGMGVVYLAHDPQLDRDVALKVPFTGSSRGPAMLERFLREARAMAAIHHPNLCPVFEVGEVDGTPYCTMPYLEGQLLTQLIKPTKPMPQRQVAALVRKLALALQTAHERGIVHRDLKPANIMISKTSGGQHEPIIMDFGLARQELKENGRITRDGAALGTPAYMPPEQVRGEVDHLGPNCDIYSLGLTMFELLTGRLPFGGNTAGEMMSNILTTNPAPPSRLRHDLDPQLEAICLRCLEKRIGDRYPTMKELAGELTRYSCEPTTSTVPNKTKRDGNPAFAELEAEPRPPVSRVDWRHRTALRALLVAVGAVLAFLAGVVIFIATRESGTPAATDTLSADTVSERKGTAATSGTPPPVQPGSPDVHQPATPLEKFTNRHGMVFALVPKGKGWLDGHDGKPGNKVEMPHDFYLGVYEVTQEEWQKVMGTNPSRFIRSGGSGGVGVWDLSDAAVKRFPVNQVSWFDCREFVKRLNQELQETGWEYRLPTEAEWEYACRGGSAQSKEAFGFNFYAGEPSDRLQPDRANFSAIGLKRPCKVGCFTPNRLGLYDMHGNVGEWCNDEKVPSDASGNEARVNRGGSWWESADYCKTEWRSRWAPFTGYGHVGLRVARVPSGK